ncbi:MAG: hypothetical protein BWK78_02465 [Thiotrichaceae bacterium IS1]|nr:MAG: hypothetical protein BWK78_02465 [Thiotrichaceae bacterium IS1]
MSLGSVYLDMSVLNEQLLEELEGVCSKPKKLLNEAAGDITTDRATAVASMVMQEAKICLDQAEESLESLRQVEGKEKSLLLANIFNQRGNLLAAQKKNTEALAAYQESAKQAKGRDQVLVAKASVNYIQVMLTNQEDCESVVSNFKEVLPELRKLPDSHDKAFTLLGLAALFKPSKVDSSQKPEKPSCSLSNEKEQLRLSAIQEALEVAKKLEDKTAMAYAYGYFAQLYAEQKRYDDAIQLTRQAIFYAQDSGRFYVNPTTTAWPGQSVAYVQSYPRLQSEFISYPEQLFRWEWQLGKLLLNGQGKLEEAVKAYERAANHLKLVGKRCGSVSRPFVKMAEDFYYEFAELLYWYHEYKKSAGEKQSNLQKILEDLTDAIESFKTNQLQNYFYSDCSNDLIEKTKRLRQASSSASATEEVFAEEKFFSPPTTALSYPLVFANAAFKNMTSLLGASHLLVPSFSSVMFSSGLRTTGTLKNHPKQQSAENKEFKFDKKFFEAHQKTAVLYLFVLDKTKTVFENVDFISESSALPEFLKSGITASVEKGSLVVSVLKNYPLSSREGPRLLEGGAFNSEQLNSTSELLQRLGCPLRGQVASDSVLENTVSCFRSKIQIQAPDILPLAQTLYQWLIGPTTSAICPVTSTTGSAICADAQARGINTQAWGIDTLVLVPSGILHTLPFAALQDEQRMYLIQKYALVVEPAGAQLTALEEKPVYGNVLLGGLTARAGGFPNTQQELNDVGRYFGAQEAFIDERFTISNFLEQSPQQSYSVVHFSTHGVFDENKPDSPYLLKYPEKETGNILSANTLSNIIGHRNVELLVLSACTSAIGGKGRDALGLAGAGSKAGARSAIGSLWQVEANATQSIVKKFYENFRTSGKAKALQTAQKEMLKGNFFKEDKYQHPAYWATFILSGNWF